MKVKMLTIMIAGAISSGVFATDLKTNTANYQQYTKYYKTKSYDLYKKYDSNASILVNIPTDQSALLTYVNSIKDEGKLMLLGTTLANTNPTLFQSLVTNLSTGTTNLNQSYLNTYTLSKLIKGFVERNNTSALAVLEKGLNTTDSSVLLNVFGKLGDRATNIFLSSLSTTNTVAFTNLVTAAATAKTSAIYPILAFAAKDPALLSTVINALPTTGNENLIKNLSTMAHYNKTAFANIINALATSKPDLLTAIATATKEPKAIATLVSLTANNTTAFNAVVTGLSVNGSESLLKVFHILVETNPQALSQVVSYLATNNPTALNNAAGAIAVKDPQHWTYAMYNLAHTNPDVIGQLLTSSWDGSTKAFAEGATSLAKVTGYTGNIPVALPTTGTATYNGYFQGISIDKVGTTEQAVSPVYGRETVSVDFAGKTFNMTPSDVRGDKFNVVTGYQGTFTDKGALVGTASTTPGTASSTATGDVVGAFVGKQAQGIVGAWKSANGTAVGQGSFKAYTPEVRK